MANFKMSKVITFSTKFPKDCSFEGEPTFFVEKIMAGLSEIYPNWKMINSFTNYEWYAYYNATPKYHTIRAGKRWKVGDKFSPRIWSGIPYRSKQIAFSEDLEVKQVWDFNINILGRIICPLKDILGEHSFIPLIAKNDGLSIPQFEDWFKLTPITFAKQFSGQIICWNENLYK